MVEETGRIEPVVEGRRIEPQEPKVACQHVGGEMMASPEAGRVAESHTQYCQVPVESIALKNTNAGTPHGGRYQLGLNSSEKLLGMRVIDYTRTYVSCYRDIERKCRWRNSLSLGGKVGVHN